MSIRFDRGASRGVFCRCHRSSCARGTTQISTPVSMRYRILVDWSVVQKDGWSPSASNVRPCRFPRKYRGLTPLGDSAVAVMLPADPLFCRRLATALSIVRLSLFARRPRVVYEEVLELSRKLIHPGFHPRVGRQELGDLVLLDQRRLWAAVSIALGLHCGRWLGNPHS